MKNFFFLFILLVTFSCTSDTTTEQAATTSDTVAVEPIAKPIVDTTPVDTFVMDTTPVPQKAERPNRKPPMMEFETMVHDYDTIEQGAVVEFAFKFKNIGERPLSIKEVRGSCGCTIGSYPFLDIAPNEENEIKARFDSKNKVGVQKTTVTVYSNAAQKEMELTLTGFVKE